MSEFTGRGPSLVARPLAFPQAAVDVDTSYTWCQQICRRSRSSFFSSFRLLDPPRRQAMYALYAFARITDDLGDNPAPAEERRRLLDAWQATLHHIDAGNDARSVPGQTVECGPSLEYGGRVTRSAAYCAGIPEEQFVALEQFTPLWPALQNSVRQFGMPLELLHAVVEGVRRDLHPQPPADWDALVDYCYHVASAVGLACVHIWKRSDSAPIPTQAAIDCGVAFQLTNILRDVAEDARQGRLYLPLSELERFQVNPDRWLAGEPNGAWLELVLSVADEAERRYQQGWATIEHLTPRSQRMFALMWCSYRTLLGQVVARRSSLWQPARIRLSRLQKFRLLAQHTLLPRFLQPTQAP